MFVITGGAGFIGSNILAEIEKRQLGEVVIADRLFDTAKWRNVSKRYSLRDIIFTENLIPYLNRHVNEVEAVLHFGAMYNSEAGHVDAIVHSNIHFTDDLFSWCTEHEKPLLFASTAGVYGDGAFGFKDDDARDALARLNPLTPMAWTKLFVERRIIEYEIQNKPVPPQWVSLRFFNLYGPNEYHKTGHQSVIPPIYNCAKNGKLFPLFRSDNPAYKNGDQMRDFMWIDDCADVVLWFLEHRDVTGVFNVGTGLARTYADVLRAVYAAVGEKPEMDFIDLPADLKGIYQYFTQADVTKLRAVGYTKSFTPLEEGVERYVKDWLSSSDPYR